MKFAIFALLVSTIAAFTRQTPHASRDASSLKVKGPSKLQYVPCIRLKDLPEPGSATCGYAGDLAICIAVDAKGFVWALADNFPPMNQWLSVSKMLMQSCSKRIDDGTIEDPVLGTKFDLKTGEVVGKWCPSDLGSIIGRHFTPLGVPTFPVRHKGGKIEVEIDINAEYGF